jgi:hypothetical protein
MLCTLCGATVCCYCDVLRSIFFALLHLHVQMQACTWISSCLRKGFFDIGLGKRAFFYGGLCLCSAKPVQRKAAPPEACTDLAPLAAAAAGRRQRQLSTPTPCATFQPTRPALGFNKRPVVSVEAARQPRARRRFPIISPLHGRGRLPDPLSLCGLTRWICRGPAYELRPRLFASSPSMAGFIAHYGGPDKLQ